MALPLIPVVIAIVAALIGGAAVLSWDEILIAWKGKKLAVLGARGVGKTQLISFLSTGSLPESYKQTIGTTKASGRRFQLKDLDLAFRETRDVSGSSDAYAEWKALCNESDIVFYLLRSDHLLGVGPDADKKSSTEARVKRDLRHISEWLKVRSEKPRFFVIGTHSDRDPGYRRLNESNQGDYADKFMALPVMKELVQRGGGRSAVEVAVGSMQFKSDAETLVYSVFCQLQD
jgi:hypothetical protein